MKDLDEQAFTTIKERLSRDKQEVARYEELGEHLTEYLSTMEEDDEWKRVSDADCLEFLLKAIPERLEEVNAALKGKLLSEEAQSYEVIKANQKKQEVQERID